MNSTPRQAVSYIEKQPIIQVSQIEYQRKKEWNEKFGSCPTNRKILVNQEGETVLDPYEIPSTVVLMPEEAFFLKREIECLNINDLDGNALSIEDLWKTFCELKHNFVECYVAYLYLKSKNWVIKSGLIFGGNFRKHDVFPTIQVNLINLFLVLYKQSPKYYHASFIAKVVTGERRSCYVHYTNERVAESTKKQMLYLEVYTPNIDPSTYLQNLDKFKVKEIVIQRQLIKQK